MNTRLVKLFLALSLVPLFAIATSAQQAEVTHGVSLRSDASSAQPETGSLSAGDTLQLIQPDPEHGYYHVRTAGGKEGWVWGRYLKVQATAAPASQAQSPSTPSGPSPSSNPTTAPVATGSPSTAISADWDKPAPVAGAYQDAEGSCGPNGDGGDTATNLRKNRDDVPASYHEVTWAAAGALPCPAAPPSRLNWSADQLAQIAPYEGVPISVAGYLVKVKVESGGSGESTNCHQTQPSEVDWHMYLTASQGQGEDASLIVETTPRVRQSHPNWTPQKLAPWSSTGAQVRISGWFMLDPEHADMVGKYRGTIWEIHPVTKIEVSKDNRWVDLDQLP